VEPVDRPPLKGPIFLNLAGCRYVFRSWATPEKVIENNAQSRRECFIGESVGFDG
jgi:hypothetical protein